MGIKNFFSSKKGKQPKSSTKSAEHHPLAQPVLHPGCYGQFPQSFNIVFTGVGRDRKTKYYCLAGDGPTPLYALTQLPGMVKHQLTLHSTPEYTSAPLALGGIDKLLTGKHCFALPPNPDAPTINQIEYVEDAGAIKAEKWVFCVKVGLESHLESFEWRGDNILQKKAGPFQRTLIRVDGPSGEEVVGIWTTDPDPKAQSRLGSVQFCGSGATGELGSYWTLFAVMALIRACQAEWMTQVVLDGMVKAAGKLVGYPLGIA